MLSSDGVVFVDIASRAAMMRGLRSVEGVRRKRFTVSAKAMAGSKETPQVQSRTLENKH